MNHAARSLMMQRSLRMFSGAVAAIAFCTVEVAAQRPDARVGFGTLLTRDRGWNYHESLELFGALGRTVGLVDVEAGASVLLSLAREVSPAVSPAPAIALRNGYAGRLHVRLPSATRSALSVLGGGEVIVDRTEGNARATTAGAMIGAGWNLGAGNRGSLDLRYVAFAKRLGTSRGNLALTLGWRL